MALREKKVIALIPARGGSKGIKDKNTYPISEKLLIDFTIEAALGSSFIDDVFVSSDSIRILQHARKMNVKEIIRPAEYATDTSNASDVVRHFHKELINSSYVNQDEDFYLSYLQPTSPLRNSRIIDESFNLLLSSDQTSLISLTENKHSPYKSFLIDENQKAESLFEESKSNECRQKLPRTYRANGAIYTFLISTFIENNGFPSNKSIAYIMKKRDSLDIDTIDDIEAFRSIAMKRK